MEVGSQWMSVSVECRLVYVLFVCASSIVLSNLVVPLGMTLMGSSCVWVCVGGDGEEGRKVLAFTAPHSPSQDVGVTLISALWSQGREYSDGGL